MSTLKSFFKNNAQAIEPKKLKLDRFEMAIEVKPLSPEQNEKIMDKSMKNIINAKGKPEQAFSNGRYLRLMAIEAVSFPDLDDAELQESYDVKGAEQLLNAMFTADEVAKIVSIATEESKNINDDIQEAKN